MVATMAVGLICPDHYSLHALNSALHVHCMHIAYQWCKVIAQGPYSVHTKKCNPATPMEFNACHRVPSLPCTRRLFNLQMSWEKKELIMILITLFLRSLWWHLTQSTIKIIMNKTLNISLIPQKTNQYLHQTSYVQFLRIQPRCPLELFPSHQYNSSVSWQSALI